jgi:hypothetical protein
MQSFDPALIPNFKVRGLVLALPSTGTRIDGIAVARQSLGARQLSPLHTAMNETRRLTIAALFSAPRISQAIAYFVKEAI